MAPVLSGMRCLTMKLLPCSKPQTGSSVYALHSHARLLKPSLCFVYPIVLLTRNLASADVNNAMVTDYKRLKGMYPHAAGLIASNGPYRTVDDLYKLPGATEHDKALFKQYRAELVAMPPGRTFYERINARQST